jgi:hypothetical protein
MLTREMLDLVESIGNNCELGFVLRKNKHEGGSVFRWVAVDPERAIQLIQDDFAGMFLFENLVPNPGGMVLDTRSNAAFHSKMKSISIGGKLEFIANEEERRNLYEVERQKFEYLVKKFHDRLQVPEVVYVIKRPRAISPEILRTLDQHLSSLRNGCPFKILHVEVADAEHPAGSFHHVEANIYRGYLRKFAPFNKTSDADYESWGAVLHSALTSEQAVKSAATA